MELVDFFEAVGLGIIFAFALIGVIYFAGALP